jgi:beta-lactam-binding protein with PASTA domain
MQRIKAFFVEAYYFLTSFVFIKNAVIMLLSFIFIIWLLLTYLDWYTLHDQTIEVPNIVGLTQPDAERLLATRSLKLQVAAERDDETKPRNSILEQYPKSGQKVKESRTIYLIVNTNAARPVQLNYKSIIGQPLSAVEQKLRNLKLKVKEVVLMEGKGENTVAEMRLGDRIIFKEADPTRGIKPPSGPVEVPKGAALTIVVYKGDNNKLRAVPDLLCLNYGAAELAIKGSQFIMGLAAFEAGILDTAAAFVIGQDPMPNAMHIPGTPVRLRLARVQPKECEILNESTD